MMESVACARPPIITFEAGNAINPLPAVYEALAFAKVVLSPQLAYPAFRFVFQGFERYIESGAVPLPEELVEEIYVHRAEAAAEAQRIRDAGPQAASHCHRRHVDDEIEPEVKRTSKA